jgi:hypothetical protein
MVAGAALGLGPRVLLLIGAALILVTAGVTVVDRRLRPPSESPKEAAIELRSAL